MDVSSLLQSKRNCLKRYLALSEEFLADAERGDLASLEGFERARDAILRALGMYDRKLTEAVRALSGELRTPALATSARDHLDEEERIIRAILAADERIMTCIELEKSRLSREMAAAERSASLASRFKSGAKPDAGEGLDTKV